MPAAYTAPDPLGLKLTAAFMKGKGMKPLYAGADWTLRFQVRDDSNEPVALTGYDIALQLKANKSKADALFTRRLGVAISDDDARLQVELDADQSAEDTATNTGKGWFTVRTSADDEVALLKCVGQMYFDIRTQAPNATLDEDIAFAGTLEVLAPVTRTAALID